MALCPKCGKPSRGLCIDCYLEEHPLELGEPKLYSCKCGKLRFHGKWNASLENVSKSVAKNIKTPYGLRLDEINIEPEVRENKLHLYIHVEGLYSDEIFKKNLTQKVKIQNATCPTCGRKSSGYFEAILQFRCGMPGLALDESQVSKVDGVRGGVDYYLLSNNYAKSVASQLKRRGYKVKASKKIYSRKDGKEIYRVSYSIKEK